MSVQRFGAMCLLGQHMYVYYVVGTQKNHLNEMVLLSAQNIC